jgi:hypothetical protein
MNDETLIQQVSRCMYEELGVEKCEKMFNERDYSFAGENNWIPSILKEIKKHDSGDKYSKHGPYNNCFNPSSFGRHIRCLRNGCAGPFRACPYRPSPSASFAG